ncbi:histidine kinase [Paenibacillus sp. GP183]|uniref:histidine kinase n=1 Tax=Paenibacillus sp. GP183 TaxID=1882751 RepID=UPI0008978C9C|nr:histidine kinase [Paenibacillus sp. GP183]SEC45622.1 two-component system, OmpR family, sensor histidine kinase KdpD [Paenibacillus sp. GP183]
MILDSFKRKTPEEILASISNLHRGRLKIYLGAVTGSGKTYHMLREGQLLKQQGIDVVICAVTTLQRPETIEQLGNLEKIPSIHWFKDGIEQKDLNLDMLIERNPEVVLVDGLAHRNRAGAQFATRLEDIKYLLSKDISVITTVNVYELAGAKEMAKKLTGIEVTETVPSDTLELADEVRLIDVTPETILSRMAEGNLKVNQDKSVFKRGNLGVLRELALRLVAEGVNDSLDKHREEMGMVGPSGATERILVSVQYHWNGSLYVRRGDQVAKRLNGDLLVVCFHDAKRAMSKEKTTFKRSIVKLVDKVGGEFEELPIVSRRSIPKILVAYATEKNVTRIVLGHSKHTRWEEFWKGSIVNDILRRTKNIDVFLMADRAEHEGERILPAKMTSPINETEMFRRLSNQEVKERIGEIKRGKFKVYIGAAPGVGKTYTMLREGNDLKKKCIQVCIGLLEAHGRKETLAQVNDLEIIPRQSIHYQGLVLEELDTEAIIRRAPDVVLIDELAHTNVPGSKNKKRYEDVLEILEAGINVITTVNVQHLESLNDAVHQITGIKVRETVPDDILRLADEVQLIDVSPQALQQRMKEGKVYDMQKVDQALSNFFKTGNLIALRELALREIADDVDERLESLERKSSLRGPWRKKEVIFVCVNDTPHAERLIRRGFRIAYRLKAAWYVNFVQTDPRENHDLNKRLEVLKKLTVRLGGKFEIHFSEGTNQIPQVLAAKAEEAGASQIIVGQSKQFFWEELWKGSVVIRLLRLVRHMDVLVVADYDPNMNI